MHSNSLLTVVLSLLIVWTTQAQHLTQLGTDIQGEATGDICGYQVSISGLRVAMVASMNQGSGPEAGHVRVYEWDGQVWAQLGTDIDAEAAGDRTRSVSLEGNRIAIGAYWNDGNGHQSGHTRVYEWDGQAWAQLGSDLDGEAAGDQSGNQVVLKGNLLAVAASYNNGNGTNAGHVRVYEWDGSAWTQRGADLDGEHAYSYFGTGLAFDGKRLAVGAPYNNGNGQEAGHVRIYEWNGIAWAQLGNDLDGEAAGDHMGGEYTIALHNDRVAVGAVLNDGSGVETGHVRVYEWNGTAWRQLGTDIDGQQQSDRFGRSVVLQGDYLAVGAIWADVGAPQGGTIQGYRWNGQDWQPSNQPEHGQINSGQLSWSLALDGDYLAASAPFAGGARGVVRVYEIQCMDWILVPVQQMSNQLSTTVAADHYQWYYCYNEQYYPINGANTDQYTAQTNSTYALEVAVDGCVYWSDCYAVTSIHVDRLADGDGITLYPNPTTDQLVVEWEPSPQSAVLRLWNLEGQLLIEQTSVRADGVTLSLANFPTGVYVLEWTRGGEVARYSKVIKKASF